jgi:hypothetical protein
LANGQVLAIIAKGNIRIEELSGEIKTIRNVLYVRGVKSNLLSVGSFMDLGHVVLFDSTRCLIFYQEQLDLIFLRALQDPKSRLYKVQGKSIYRSDDIVVATQLLSSSHAIVLQPCYYRTFVSSLSSYSSRKAV